MGFNRFKGFVINRKAKAETASESPLNGKRTPNADHLDEVESQKPPSTKNLRRPPVADQKPTNIGSDDSTHQREDPSDNLGTTSVSRSRYSNTTKQPVLRQFVAAGPSSTRHPSRLPQIQNVLDEEPVSSTHGGSPRSSISGLSDIWSETPGGRVGPTKHPPLSIAAELDCKVAIQMCGTPLDIPQSLRIRWLAEGQYDIIYDHIRRRLGRYFHSKHPDKAWPIIYRTSAEVTISKHIHGDDYQNLATETVRHPDHWAQLVPTLVGEHGSANPFTTLRLEVTWRFDTVDVQGQDGTTLADKMWNVVHLKLVKNWRGESFLPRTDLDGIFSEDIIRELMNKDPQPNNMSDADGGERWTPAWLSVNASGLFALCIYAQKPLSCLHQLVINYRKSNKDLPLGTLPPGLHDRDVEPLRNNQKTFLVYNFNEEKLRQKLRRDDYEVVPAWQTVPIIYIRRLGEGGFGVVSEVTIHSDHHNFREDTFALKELKAIPAVSTAFAAEGIVFSNLMRVDHPHILIPLAMWRQKHSGPHDAFYMLYPKAERNLKDELRRHRKRPKLEKHFVAHLVAQLFHLVDALQEIHLLRKRSGLVEDGSSQSNTTSNPDEPGGSSLHPSAAEKSSERTAYYHHDLKPENILIFKDGSWKISDFGTAGITQAISGRSVHQVSAVQSGDPIYKPPDHAMGTRTVRPYDIWCFGCILLEILLTAFQVGTDDQFDEIHSEDPASHRLDVFDIDRAMSVEGGVGSEGMFWYEKSDGSFDLRPPVKIRLADLHRRTRSFDQFNELVQLAEDMLAIQPSKRPPAEKVLARIRTVYLQVNRNLDLNENFYTHPNSVPPPFAAQPTTDGTSQGSSPSAMTLTRHLSAPEIRRGRRHSAPTTTLAQLQIAGGPSYRAVPAYETAVDGTPTTPAVRVSYADNISLTSSDEGAASGEEATRESTRSG